MSMEMPERLVRRLADAESVTALTGAGVSAESGVPTFRGIDGLWAKLKAEELASMAGFMRNPALVWEWYRHRRRVIAEVQPNPGHYALARMEEIFPHCAIITQNIDNLHRRAGSRNVIELHGNIERNYCMTCGANCPSADLLPRGGVPLCSRCGGTVRPDVVWFGEMLPAEAWEQAVRATESADIFLSIGTSGLVFPAASLPLTAKRQGALLVEINPEPTPLSDKVDLFLQGLSGVLLPALVAAADRVREGLENTPEASCM